MKQRIGKLVGLFVVTVFAVAVMYVSGGRNTFSFDTSVEENAESSADQVAETVSPVIVTAIEKQPIEILDSYAGTITPLERFSLAFQVAGQIESLGNSSTSRMLDVGDYVEKGQVLATLDRRILNSRRDEAAATLELAQTEYQRLSKLKERSPGAVTQTSYQQASRELAVSTAMLQISEKNLEDAVLVAPVSGVISQRMINPGESIDRNQMAFELVQVDHVLLSVGVPESRIVAIQRRFNATKLDSATKPSNVPGHKRSEFPVYVRRYETSANLEPDVVLNGTVYRIAETADDDNGLFKVEVLLENTNRLLKPGLVAKAELVVDVVSGYRIPVNSVVYHAGSASLFFATIPDDKPEVAVDFVGLPVAQATNFVAHQVPMSRAIEQGQFFIVPDLPSDLDLLVTKGQHRLVEGKPLEIIQKHSLSQNPISPGAESGAAVEVSRLNTSRPD